MEFDNLPMFATAPPGLERLVAEELTDLGVSRTELVPGGVAFAGDLETLYRANLWLRIAGRVLVRIDQFFVVHLAKLHKKAKGIPWERFLDPEVPVAIHGACRKSRIYHSKAASERVAMGIAERLGLTKLPRFGDGNIEEDGETLQVLVRIDRDHCSISLDSSGEHLHRRGYRTESTLAPLRETLAAAVLRLAGFDGSESLVDPMCGSGTIPIEAALMAARVAPGIHRQFAFMEWPSGDPALWGRLVDEAADRVRPLANPIHGSDIDAEAIWISQRNAERAGVFEAVLFERASVAEVAAEGNGLFLCNPPYGKRIGERRQMRGLYAALGDVLARHAGWRLGLIAGDQHFAAATGLDFCRVTAPFPNGGVRVKLFLTGERPARL